MHVDSTAFNSDKHREQVNSSERVERKKKQTSSEALPCIVMCYNCAINWR